MMNKLIQEIYVYGKLLTEVGHYELLAPEPELKNLPFYLRTENTFSFYVIASDGVARHVIVHSNFVIEPYAHPRLKEVTFEVDDEVE